MLYVFSYMQTVYFKFCTQCAYMCVGHNTRKCIMRRGLKKEWKQEERKNTRDTDADQDTVQKEEGQHSLVLWGM